MKILLPAIHHHFHFTPKFLCNPIRFNEVVFESVPFFKLYPMESLKQARDMIDVLSYHGMPHRFQTIMGQLIPRNSNNVYKAELIPMTYCTYNRQSFFVRAYRLRQNNFFKIEIIVHSATLGKENCGKYYTFEKALRAAASFFERMEEELPGSLSFERHLPEYFLPDIFVKKVRVWRRELESIKQAKNRHTRRKLKEKLCEELQSFEKNSKKIAWETLSSQKTTEDFPSVTHTNSCTSHELVDSS